MEESSELIEILLKDVNNTWSNMVCELDRSQKICSNLSIPIIRFFYHAKLIVQDVTSGDRADRSHCRIKELQQDVIVECYLEAKYYHYDPEEIYELIDFNVNAENLVKSDDIVTVQNIRRMSTVLPLVSMTTSKS